ncbi:MAG: aminotransferase class III-fold pyridoxal phosphate-dependent enzyme, partial [Pseudomonadota bacterium]
MSAFILEPIVQGASGMRMCRPEFLKSAIKLAKAYDILIIYDEVMTGFGRTGTLFAAEQLTIEPDFICLSKGITGGFLPLSLTVTSKNIYDKFYSDDWNHTFTHGHSYTANPIACTAANASYELLIASETKQSIKAINKCHLNNLYKLYADFPQIISKPRICGTIAAFDVNNKHANIKTLRNDLFAQGLLVRPLGNTFYLLPP